MSKVVHLSDDSHRAAKAYCKENGLRMSDWVGSLIEAAIAGSHVEPEAAPAPAAPRVVSTAHYPDGAVVPRRSLRSLEETGETAEDGTAVYSAPPFWQQRRRSG